MKIRENHFPALVRQEAEGLRKHLTQEENYKLYFESLRATNTKLCIYGQLTGSCFSDRATELIELCCSRVYDSWSNDIKDKLSLLGSPINRSRYNYWSPIEVFICHASDKMKKRLIDYIKGNVKTLPK